MKRHISRPWMTPPHSACHPRSNLVLSNEHMSRRRIWCKNVQHIILACEWPPPRTKRVQTASQTQTTNICCHERWVLVQARCCSFFLDVIIERTVNEHLSWSALPDATPAESTTLPSLPQRRILQFWRIASHRTASEPSVRDRRTPLNRNPHPSVLFS